MPYPGNLTPDPGQGMPTHMPTISIGRDFAMIKFGRYVGRHVTEKMQ
jgi:hypothetical protein